MADINPNAVRKLVLKFCQCISDRHFSILPTLFTPDSTWTVIADPVRASYGGTTSAEDQIARFPGLLAGFQHFSFDATGVIVEGNRAAVDVKITGRGSGEGRGNERYENEYLMWVVTDEEGEKIRSVKQSLDCYQVEEWLESKREVVVGVGEERH